MSVQITIAGTVYNFPESGETPNWGRDATETIVAMAAALNTLLAPGDILQTAFNIDNNVSIPQNINGLLFDSGITRAANIYYTIYRTSDTNPEGNAEVSSAFLVYDDDAPVNEKWKMTVQKNGSAGVILYIDDDGQVTYTSSDLGVSGYTGIIKFSARTLTR